MITWCAVSPDKRYLRRVKKDQSQKSSSNASGPSNSSLIVLLPNVYPQDKNQMEDKLTPSMLSNGYQHQSLSVEYDTHFNELGSNTDSIDEKFKNITEFLRQTIQRKSEQNIVWLDKQMIKEGTFRTFQDLQVPHKDFFVELTSRKFQILVKRFVIIKRSDDDQELKETMFKISDLKIPYQRAIWFLKMNQIANPPLTLSLKSKRSSSELYSSDLSQFAVRFLSELISNAENEIGGKNTMVQHWLFFTNLFKNLFELGAFDRYEFLTLLCDILHGQSQKFYPGKPYAFTLLVFFVSQFSDLVVKNFFISRKLSGILIYSLQRYKKFYDDIKGKICDPNNFYHGMVSCKRIRPLFLTMMGLLTYVLADCPDALIWNQIDSNEIEMEQQWLSGSPFDKLSFTIDDFFAQDDGPANNLLRTRISEIKSRSLNASNYWASCIKNGSDTLVELCLDILYYLDTTSLNESGAVNKMHDAIFCSSNEHDSILRIRIRIILQWAVTSQREGVHRSLIVCEILKIFNKNQIRNNSHFSLQEILMECMNKDAPSRNSSACFHVEFANFIQLFYELQLAGLFSHDLWVRGQIHEGQFDFQMPISLRIDVSKVNYVGTDAIPTINAKPLSPSNTKDCSPSFFMDSKEKMPVPAIISFIPDVPTVSSASTASYTSSLPVEELFGLLPPNSEDNHPYLENSDEFSFQELLLLHLPIDQIPSNRDICNQRLTIIYGITPERDLARLEIDQMILDICRLWQKRLSADISDRTREIKIRSRKRDSNLKEFDLRRDSTKELDTVDRFRKQSYYDQVLICGYCAESFIESLASFVKCNTRSFPIAESLDILCGMFHECRDINALMTFSIEVLYLLPQMEDAARSFESDYVHGVIAHQLGYVIIAHLAEHFYYFLYSGHAPKIINLLYQLISHELERRKLRSGWARAIAMFLLQAENEVIEIGLDPSELTTDVVYALENIERCLERVFAGPEKKPSSVYNFNSKLVENLFVEPPKNGAEVHLSFGNKRQIEPRRFYCHSEYYDALSQIYDLNSNYSFVVNAFIMACEIGDDYDKLVELSNVCSNISAEKEIIDEWYFAIQELCNPNVSSMSFSHLIQKVNTRDFAKHSTLSTFIFLLASKYCFSVHVLITCLLHPLIPIAEKLAADATQTKNRDFENGDGLCLTLYIISSLVCATDLPFNYYGIATDAKKPRRLINFRDANRNALRISQIRELDFCIFPLLAFLQNTVAILKARVNPDVDPGDYRKRKLDVARCALFAICEQEWVIQRVFRLCDTRDVEVFNTDKLNHSVHSLATKLLRTTLRRKSERNIKQKLMECESIPLSTNMLLSELTIWNLRATFYDFKLIMKLDPQNGTPGYQHAYFKLNSYIETIANECRNLFEKDLFGQNEIPASWNLDEFSFDKLTPYWLFAPLLRSLPPIPAPDAQNQLSLKAAFLSQASSLFTDSSSKPEGNSKAAEASRIHDSHSKIIHFLSYQPFLNLILACASDDGFGFLDGFLDQLHTYLKSLVNKVIKKPSYPYQSQSPTKVQDLEYQLSFRSERESLLLCVPLIGSLFDSIIARLRTTKENIDWAYVLFQILYYDIIMLERDGEYFYTCYDMFSTLCCVMFGLNAALYEKFVAKIRRECPYIPEEMDKLSQLLPFPKSLAENSAWEYFYPSPQKAQISAATKNGNNTTQQQQQQTPKPKIKAVVLDRQPETAQQQLIKLLHHTHYHNFIRPQLPGFEGPGPDLFLSPPEMELVTDDLLEEPSPISNIMQTTDPSSTHLQVHRQHQQPHHIQQQDGSQVSQEQRHEQMHQFQSMFSAGQSEGQTQGLHLSLQTREFKHEPNELHSAIAGTFNPDQPMFHTESMGIPGHQTNLNVFPENGMKFESPQPHVSHQMGLSGNNSGGMMMPVSTTIGQPMPQPPMGMGGHQNFGQINVMGPQPGVDLQQQQMLNLMRQRAGEHIVPRNGSGSSTPTATLNTTESPRNTSGGGRGGRRKNAASTSSQPGEPPVQGGRKRKNAKAQQAEQPVGVRPGMADMISNLNYQQHPQQAWQQQMAVAQQQHHASTQQIQIAQQIGKQSSQQQQFMHFPPTQQHFSSHQQIHSKNMPLQQQQQMFGGPGSSMPGGMGSMQMPMMSGSGPSAMIGGVPSNSQPQSLEDPKKHIRQNILQKMHSNQHPT